VTRNAWEAGVSVASAYPGTPSTEILEYFARYPNVYAEWARLEVVNLVNNFFYHHLHNA
jgi:indolepyruvate ferredoxin oxidoreductase alpha subunit